MTRFENRPNLDVEVHPAPIVIFGAGRSGTTWLAEIIAAAGLELIFEPLNEQEVPEATEFRRSVCFLDASDPPEPWAPLFSSIFHGEIRNPWTLRAGTQGNRKLIKFIRANFVIDWLLRYFHFLPVFIIRNPLAVVASLLTEGWEIPESWVRWVVSDSCPAQQHLPPLGDFLTRPLDPVELFALYWSIQNAVPQRQGLFSRISLVRYEELWRNPEEITEGLAPLLGIKITPPVLEACHRWSLMKGRHAEEPSYDPTKAWEKSLTRREIDIVVRIVSYFGLQEYLPQ